LSLSLRDLQPPPLFSVILARWEGRLGWQTGFLRVCAGFSFLSDAFVRHVAPGRTLPPLPAHVAAAAATAAVSVAAAQRERKQRQRAMEQPKSFFAPVFMITPLPPPSQQQQQQQSQKLQQSNEFEA
jgi:hypothetical protein